MDFAQLPNALPEGAGFEPIQRQELAWPDQLPEDLAVLKVIEQDVSRAEAWLSSKQITRDWLEADRLYLAWVPQQTWEGTNVPRAALGMPLVMEHVESILPQIMAGFFSDPQPFQIAPRPKTTEDAARANADLLQWEFEQSDFREQFRQLAKSVLLYGNGIGKWGWKTVTNKRVEYRRKEEPQVVGGGVSPIEIPTAASDELVPVEVVEEINLPTFEAIPLRHVLVDPGLRSNDIRKAKWVGHRLYLTSEQLDELREVEGYQNIPTRAQLEALVTPVKEPAITSPLEQPLYGSNLTLATEFKAQPRPQDSTVDPLKQGWEVIEYYTKDHIYTILQRKLVIRKERNEWGKLPFVSCAYTDVLDSFYALGIAKIIGPEQRLQQGIINAHLDDVSLSLNGMYQRKRGLGTPSQPIRMRPGATVEYDDQNGITLLPRHPINGDALAEISASDARAQRRTAANEMIVQGSLPSHNSSITRTATGVQALSGGSGARLQYLVEQLADLVFLPVLKAFHEMNGKRLKPSQITRILSDELNSAYQGDSLDLINGQYDFSILAGARMQSKRSLGQSLPLLYQFYSQAPVLDGLAQVGLKLDFNELSNMTMDASGWPNKSSLIVPMSKDEIAQRQAGSPAAQAAQMQQAKSQQDLQNKMAFSEQSTVDKVGRDIVRSLLKKGETAELGIQ